MKLKLVLVGLVVALLSVSAAVAAPPPGKGKPVTTPPPGKGKPATAPGKGKPPKTGLGCKPMVTVVLKGTLTGAPGSSLSMSVSHGNRWARAYVAAGFASVAVDQSTQVRRNGKKMLTDLVVGDWLLVQARACKADLAANAMPALTAVRVVAHPAKA